MYILLSYLIFILLAKSADNKLWIFFLLFTENKVWHFIQIVSSFSFRNNLFELASHVFCEKNQESIKYLL